jgi:hypothetical protein
MNKPASTGTRALGVSMLVVLTSIGLCHSGCGGGAASPAGVGGIGDSAGGVAGGTNGTGTTGGASGGGVTGGGRGGASGGGMTAGGAGGAAGGGSAGSGVVLMPDATGYVDGATNPFWVTGSWYAYGDSLGATGVAPGDCQTAGHPDSACAQITSPVSGGFPNTAGKMCTTGTVETVVDIVGMTGMPDYSKMWGAGIGIDLNHPAMGPRGVFDAVANQVIGISFDLDVKPAAGLRVEVQTVPTDGTVAGNDYWGATASYPPSPVVVGTNTMSWSAVTGPKGHFFDPTEIEAIQFHVPSSTAAGSLYSFCISNFKMLTP